MSVGERGLSNANQGDDQTAGLVRPCRPGGGSSDSRAARCMPVVADADGVETRERYQVH
jgi:hypothetical protein